jgi:serine/threonine-protein kinase
VFLEFERKAQMDEVPTLAKAGRYQIVRELGRGSMGVVYQGYDPVIGRTVAIKTMLTEGLTPQEFQEFKERFQREAQAAGALAHPNIVTVYDFGEDNGVLYLAMEFLEGKSLEKLVHEQGLLPIETIIPTYEQVCSALDDAHAHKIVHRDIKPANIMILDSGLVKVTDFGIAKMMSLGMTQAGQILGTPNYMSPEQVKGRLVDGRSDIFSLGVILYELVTGEKPFGGQNITTVIYKIINENPIPPLELDATIHPGLSYVISKALAKNPDERYQTCRELADDLKGYRNLGDVTPPSATVIVRVPPIQGTQPTPTAAPVAPQAPVQVIPPAKIRAGTSAALWALLTLGIIGILGGGYYFYAHRAHGTRVAENISPPATPATQQPTQPAEPATQPPTTEQPTAAPPPAPTTESNAPTAGPAGGPPLPTATPTGGGPAPKVGLLLVDCSIRGAKISIDDRSDPGWVTPHDAFQDISAGTHTVRVSKAGYSDFVQSVTIAGGQTNTLPVHLSAPSGEFTIKTNPVGLEVIIDGQSYGPSPARYVGAPGPHKFRVMLPDGTPHDSTFTVVDGESRGTVVNVGGGTASWGIILVNTIPSGATVLADGTACGGTTPTNCRLSLGHHTLIISLAGYQKERRDIDVTTDGNPPIDIRLSPQSQ